MVKKKNAEVKSIKLDLGCGKNKKEGFLGVDSIKFPGVDIVQDLTKKWQWEDNSVDEVHASHFVEHLEARQRVHFVNELYRVLKPGKRDSGGKPIEGFATIITPSWCSNRAYGDMTHKWPPVSEMWYYYLLKEWRTNNCPHDDIDFNKDGYSCNFDASWGYVLHPNIVSRNQEYQQNALTFWKEAAQDIIATLVKR
jgi:hypothetical protein